MVETVERSNEIATPYFTVAWENWDYLRDNYGPDHNTSPVADASPADIIEVAKRVANDRLDYFEEYKDDLSIIDGQVYFETEVEPIVPDHMIWVPEDVQSFEEILDSSKPQKND